MERHTTNEFWLGLHMLALKEALNEIDFYQYPKNEADFKKRTIMQYKSLRSFTDLYYSFKEIVKKILPLLKDEIENFYNNSAKEMANDIKHANVDLVLVQYIHGLVLNPPNSAPLDEETVKNFYLNHPSRESFKYFNDDTFDICKKAYDELNLFYIENIKSHIN